ncbi:hypothetical protein [Bacillus marasmi]|uniref:hypothetical protein n=1 Tax=Bacillus marasmi TaxID=1926279 RepID=UPI0011C984B4|nr:hypothetical protein [Bacillus marasmi]
MEKAERLNLLCKLDELFKVCESCEKNKKGSNSHIHVCKGCSTDEEMRDIGQKLESGKEDPYKNILIKGQDMTISEVKRLISEGVKRTPIRRALGMDERAFYEFLRNNRIEIKERVKEEEVVAVAPVKEDWLPVEKYISLNKNLKDKQIAERLGVPYKKLINWKQKHKDELKGRIIDRRGRQTVTAEEEKPMSFVEAGKQAWDELKDSASKIVPDTLLATPSPEIKEPETNWKAQFEMLSAEYEEVVAKAGEAEKVYKEQIFGLEEKLKELEGIHAACADVEDELHQLRMENINLNDQVYAYRAKCEFLKDDLETTHSFTDDEIARLNAENEALRKLVKLWS